MHRGTWIKIGIISTVALLSACRGGVGLDRAQTEQSKTPWFCQPPSIDATAAPQQTTWDCVQDAVLAANPPEINPLPVKPAEPEWPTPQSPPQIAQNTREPDAIATTAFAPTTTPARSALTTAPEAPAARVVEQSAPRPSAPIYETLAFKPKQAISLMDVPSEFWAVQLVAVSSKSALENFAKEHKIQGVSAAETAVNDKLFYVLLLGIYETRENAELAATELPYPFKEPWIRPMASLQRAMARAEAFNARS